MKDLVLQGFVNNFADGRGLSHLPQEELFEAFTTYSLLRKQHQCDIADIDDNLLVGGSEDGGIDAIAILVNGRPVHTADAVRFFADNLQRLDVDFVFVQAKTSPHFRAADITHSIFGVEQFFTAVLGGEPRVQFNAEILEMIDLAKDIYGQSIRMRHNPNCFFYFATTGKWEDPPDPRERFAAGVHQLQEMKIFTEVHASPVDAELLKAIYRDLERGVVKDIEFSKAAVFPRINGVDDAYIGLLPGREFISLVSTDDGDLNRDLFYDNVRDYQGYNPVNSEISHTLSDDTSRQNFPLLNNGVTIVARDLRRTGDTFTISDFQIVNGCQTTHIMFQNRESIGAETFVPIKLVATRNQQVVTEVIKATNRQTAVLPEALESLTPFHKDLEDFYEGQEAPRNFSERIHYERRSKQYTLDNIDPKNIVSLTGQIKSFVAMFLNEPHSHPRYYGELLRSYEGRIFAPDHKPEPYYASGVALLTVEQWLASHSRYRSLRSYKHQMLMLLRAGISGPKIPRLNSNEISEYALEVVRALRDSERGPRECRRAADHLRTILSDFPSRGGNAPHRLRAFTERLVGSLDGTEELGVTLAAADTEAGRQRERGTIKWFDEWKNYGFVSRHAEDDVFVHGSEIGAVPWHRRVGGQEVEFLVVPNPRSRGMLMAAEVSVAPSE